MKRFLVALLVFGTAATVFAPQAQAQFAWNLIVDFNTGLVSWNNPTGEKAKKFITVGSQLLPNIDTAADSNNPINERGDYTYSRGSLDIFNYGRGSWLRANELRLIVDYYADAVDLHVRSLLDELVRAEGGLATGPGGQNETSGKHSLVMGTGRTPNLSDFLRYSFDEWYVRGFAGFLAGYVGNTPNRGTAADFNAFTDDVLRNIVIEYYGVNTPTIDADFSYNGRDINNFSSRQSMEPGNEDEAANYSWIMPYYMVGLKLDVAFGKTSFPVIFQIAADPGNNTGVVANDNYLRFNGSVRLSAEKIADSVTFDAIYRFRGGDRDTMDNYDGSYYTDGTLQPNGTGISSHAFGLYSNIHNVPKLGIGLGYSGYVINYQDKKDKTTKAVTARSGPLYSGIDLRLQYSGFNKLVLTSVNNVSFASSGPSTGSLVSYGIFGTESSNYAAQEWLGLYNALGLDYKVTDKFTASFQIANRFGHIAAKDFVPGSGLVTTERSRMRLGGGAYAAYQFNKHLLVQGGLAFHFLNDSYSNSSAAAQSVPGTRNAGGGTFSIAIPIRMSLVYGTR